MCGNAERQEIMSRNAAVTRVTKETDIQMNLELDGSGKSKIDTGIGFFDLDVVIKGDLDVDGHHTVEDAGIVLGSAIKEAVGDKKGIKRYGYFILPMDDALALCAVDLCGRPYLNFECSFPNEMVGALDTSLVKEFFYAVSYSAAMNIHIKMLSGCNSHHMIEAIFKAFAKALDSAVSMDDRISDVLSTKGSL